MSTAEELEQGLKRNLLLVLVGFVLWMGFDIVAELLRAVGVSAVWIGIANAVSVIGMLVWMFSFLQGRRLKRKMQLAPKLTDALLHDELAKYAERRGFEVGFKVTMVTLGLLWLASLFLALSPTLILQATIVVAVMAWAITFLHARENPEAA